MGKFGNFELTAEQRRVQELKNQQRAALRAQFWKHMTDPKRHASGEGGHLVSANIFLLRRKSLLLFCT